MSAKERLKHRQHFFHQHSHEFLESIQRVLPVFLNKHPLPRANSINCDIDQSSCCNETKPSLTNTKELIDWLKKCEEDDFFTFCFVLLDTGEFPFFSALIAHHAVDCHRLEKAAKCSNLRCFKKWVQVLQENGSKTSIISSNDDLPEAHCQFLRKHKETLRLLMVEVDGVVEYLRNSSILSYEQFLIIKATPSEERVYTLVDYLTNKDAVSDSYHRFCYSLILSGQFRLFSIFRDLVDVHRLVKFHKEIDSLMAMENDENTCTQAQQSTVKYVPNIQQVTEKKGESTVELTEDEEGVPLPSGILEDLSVDRPDTNVASHLDYYSTAAQKQDPKGLALVINNHKFQQYNPGGFLRNRDGTEVDKKNIVNLLTQLGYRVLPALTDLSAGEMLQSVHDFATHHLHSQMDSCVVVVLTHGEYDYFTGVDGNKVNLHRFLSCLNARNAPSLAGKPKIFIMQACRGEVHDSGIERYVPVDGPDTLLKFRQNLPSKQTIQGSNNASAQQEHGSTNNKEGYDADQKSFGHSLFSCIGIKSSSSSSLPPTSSHSRQIQSFPNSHHKCQNYAFEPKQQQQSPSKQQQSSQFDPKLYKVIKEPSDADMLIAYATTPNYVSWRNSMNGTWFVQSICEVFSRYSAQEDIITMLTRVNKQVAQVYQSSNSGAKQIPEMASRLRKKFYFFPGVDSE